MRLLCPLHYNYYILIHIYIVHIPGIKYANMHNNLFDGVSVIELHAHNEVQQRRNFIPSGHA